MPTSVGILALIKASEVSHPDHLKDRGRYKIGDIVEVWGPGKAYIVPCAPPFCLIEVTGIPISLGEAKARYQAREADVGSISGRRRVYWIDLTSLPQANKNDLVAQRFTTITWNKIRASIKNKVTGLAEG